MVLPSPYNPISLGQIQTEFCGSDPIALAGEYYRGGAYVTQNNTNVPTSGTISLSNFYGATRAYIETISFTRDAGNQNIFYLNSPGLPTIEITTTVDGGGSVSTYYIPVNTTFTVTSNPNTSIRLTGNTMQLDDNIDDNPDGDYNDLTITPNIGYFYESGGNFYYVLNRACGENEFIVRISSTTTNVNLQSLFEATYPGSWAQTVPKRVVIDSGVIIGATNTSNYALNIPSGFGGTVKVDNYGSIQGAGGVGSGVQGGNAIFAGAAGITINNLGTIYAGGGSGGTGGTGGAGSYTAQSGIQYSGIRGVNGPSYGADASVATIQAAYQAGCTLACKSAFGSNYYSATPCGYTIIGNDICFPVCKGAVTTTGGCRGCGPYVYKVSQSETWNCVYDYNVASAGGAGGNGGPGQGYNQSAAGGSGGFDGGTNAGGGGTGGTGGAFGASGGNGFVGANGTVGTAPVLGAAGGPGYGGLAGYYIVNNGNVTWTATGTRLGRVA
jgi:hypothetical protein